jgi:hypothetical protein
MSSPPPEIPGSAPGSGTSIYRPAYSDVRPGTCIHGPGTKLNVQDQHKPFSAHNKHQKRLAAGFRPDPLGELTTLPRLLADARGPLRGRGERREGRKGREKERGGEGWEGKGGREGEDRIQTRHLQLSKKTTVNTPNI